MPDIPGEEEADIGTLEEWLSRDMQGDSDDPSAVFVALANGEVAGFAKLSLWTDRTDRAFHDLTGVKRRCRGRGIAAALKRTQIALGEGSRLHLAADLERGPERADPAPQRAVRLCPRAGRRDRARHVGVRMAAAWSRPPSDRLLDRAPADHAGEMGAELRARGRVGQRFGSVCHVRRRIGVARDERLLDRGRPQRRPAHVRERDPSASMPEPLSRARALRRRPSPSPAPAGVYFIYDQPVDSPSFGTRISVSISPGPTAVSKTPVKKSAAATVRSPSGPAITNSASEREHHRRQVGRRVAVGERAADRAAMPHLRVADHARRRRDDRAVLLDERVAVHDRLVARQRPDRELRRPHRGRTRGRRAGRCRRASTAVRCGASCAGTSEWPPASSFASSSRAEQLERVLDATRRPRSRTLPGS